MKHYDFSPHVFIPRNYFSLIRSSGPAPCKAAGGNAPALQRTVISLRDKSINRIPAVAAPTDKSGLETGMERTEKLDRIPGVIVRDGIEVVFFMKKWGGWHDFYLVYSKMAI
jgi:hypothetical protein